MQYSGMDMTGKTVLITGATNGIGRVAARELAKFGADVVIVARNAKRGESALEWIKKDDPNLKIELMTAELFSMADVRKLAKDFRARHNRLDVLLNNAGALFFARRLTVDGLERTFALNHMAYFILTNQLLELLRASAPARIINVSSSAHYSGRVNLNDLQSKGLYFGLDAYSNSKLMNIMFTYELSRRLAGTSVTANAVHPGLVASGFAHNNGFIFSVGMLFLKPISLTPEQGADTLIWLAASPEVEGVTGKFWYQRTAHRSLRESYDEELQAKLWQASEQIAAREIRETITL